VKKYMRKKLGGLDQPLEKHLRGMTSPTPGNNFSIFVRVYNFSWKSFLCTNYNGGSHMIVV
jgi:hypothetical protein